MANFAAVGTYLEGVINTGLNATRQTQGVWEWYNGLFRIVSQNRFTGTPKVVGVKATAAAAATTVLETVAARVFGILIDNPHATENTYVNLYNAAATAGTTDPVGSFYAPAALMSSYIFAEGLVFSSRLEILAVLGTKVGWNAGTGSTTQPNYVILYTT